MMLGVCKVHSLIGQVFDRSNLESAWKKVKANKGAAGVDGVSVARFDERADLYLDVLERKLGDGSYRPLPVRRVEIPKGSGGTRGLGIPTVMDRVCQQALKQKLEPVFEPSFAEASHGYRPRRSAHSAIARVKQQLEAGDVFVVDLDLARFFDTIPTEPLIDAVAMKVADGKVLGLIRLFLEAGVLHSDGRRERTFAGTPQGGVISPLLANIYLDHFDKEMERRGFRLTRYADDGAPRTLKEVPM